jgi:putative transposase
MKQLHFAQEQVTKILTQIAEEKGGTNTLLQLSLEAMMRSERQEHNSIHNDVSNGYRFRKSFGQGKLLELQVPRSRYGQFYPVLLSILKDQEEESKRLAFSLYGKGLTTEQVGELFEELYGRHYSTSSISRMFNYTREEVSSWLNRPLENYYPILCIDATFIPTRRGGNVSKEGYYTILGVKSDRTREVLAVVNYPTESSTAWQHILGAAKAFLYILLDFANTRLSHDESALCWYQQ